MEMYLNTSGGNVFIQFRVRERSTRKLLYLEGSSGLYKSHTFLGETREWQERKPVAVREALRNRTLIVLFWDRFQVELRRSKEYFRGREYYDK